MESQPAWSGAAGITSVTPRFWAIHARLAGAATSGAHFCREPVGARVDAQRSNFRSSRYRARSRCLQSLGAFGLMVLVQLARGNGSNRGIFAIFIFEALWRALAGGCEHGLLDPGGFGQRLEVCRVLAHSNA